MCVLLTTCLALSLGDAAGQGTPPNVILMMADDLGWGDPHYMGNRYIRTPNLDAMADAGLRFNRFYSGAPVCSPTRGSCLTGRHPYRYGIFSANVGRLPAKELTLAELLRKRGYTTGHFGKWHLGTLTRTERDSNRGGPSGTEHYSPPWENGFDVCFSTEAKVPTWDPMICPKDNKRRRWWDPVTDPSQAEPFGTAYWSNGKKVNDNPSGDDSRIIMDRVIPFIRGAAGSGKPFFAVIWFHAPHLPVVAGPEYTKMYARFAKYQQHYFGCITALDEQVGRLRDELRALEVADSTMVWFCSDNGPEGAGESGSPAGRQGGPEAASSRARGGRGSAPGSAGHLRGRKRSLFEGGIRVPGILEWPARIKTGRVTDLPACTSDYLPTILDALGVKPVDDRPTDGVSLLPLIEAAIARRPRPIGFESGRQIALIDNRYKIIGTWGARGRADKSAQPGPGEPLFMLFDLIADPSEKHDIAGRHPDVVNKMAAELEAFRRSCKDSREGKDY